MRPICSGSIPRQFGLLYPEKLLAYVHFRIQRNTITWFRNHSTYRIVYDVYIYICIFISTKDPSEIGLVPTPSCSPISAGKASIGCFTKAIRLQPVNVQVGELCSRRLLRSESILIYYYLWNHVLLSSIMIIIYENYIICIYVL